MNIIIVTRLTMTTSSRSNWRVWLTYCMIKHYNILCHTVFWYIISYYIILYYIILYYIILYYILYYIISYQIISDIALYYIILYQIMLYYIIIHYIKSHYSILHFILLYMNTMRTVRCLFLNLYLLFHPSGYMHVWMCVFVSFSFHLTFPYLIFTFVPAKLPID